MGPEDVGDGAVKGALWIVLILAVFTVGVLVGGPVLALYILLKGWNDTGVLVKLLAFISPFLLVFMIVINPNNNTWGQLETIWSFIMPVITYAILFIAYARRDQMFNV